MAERLIAGFVSEGMRVYCRETADINVYDDFFRWGRVLKCGVVGM